MSLTKNLKLIGVMATKGVTIKGLAEMIGMSYSTLQRKIAGRSPFDTAEIKQIMIALELTPDEAADIFLGGRD